MCLFPDSINGSHPGDNFSLHGFFKNLQLSREFWVYTILSIGRRLLGCTGRLSYTDFTYLHPFFRLAYPISFNWFCIFCWACCCLLAISCRSLSLRTLILSVTANRRIPSLRLLRLRLKYIWRYILLAVYSPSWLVLLWSDIFAEVNAASFSFPFWTWRSWRKTAPPYVVAEKHKTKMSWHWIELFLWKILEKNLSEGLIS